MRLSGTERGLLREGTGLSLSVLADFYEEKGANALSLFWRKVSHLVELAESGLTGPCGDQENYHRAGLRMYYPSYQRTYFKRGQEGLTLWVTYAPKTISLVFQDKGKNLVSFTVTRQVCKRDGIGHVRARVISEMKWRMPEDEQD